ncbi:hypothetical protein HMPREF3033_00624 [Veillonellaceae bacterium DNF00751]|nr:hypothetical protein HMPREF3033_00624 [Veillonellaceae bacterium DNF00751]
MSKNKVLFFFIRFFQHIAETMPFLYTFIKIYFFQFSATLKIDSHRYSRRKKRQQKMPIL